MVLVPGMAFRSIYAPRHIYIPLFGTENSTEFLLVNFSTLREGCVDDACVLNSADYTELKHETTVVYSKAIIGDKNAFLKAVADGKFVQMEDLPSATFAKIIAGAHQSEELSKRQKALLPVA
jgi:hypothetical protein